jgi:spermidine/putrescine transport system ATP-binding protein
MIGIFRQVENQRINSEIIKPMVNHMEADSAIATPYQNQTAVLQLSQIVKIFDGGEAAIRGIDLAVNQGEFFSILGPSGCGKTTLLRLIAGFETPTAGTIAICGQNQTLTPPYRRPVNTVFQSYALFNHMTVWNNIAFGLNLTKLPRPELCQRVNEALRLVKMETFASRYPAQLSGGQQQRVALARAIVNRPTIVLLDEPLAALDLKLRKEMQVELANLHQRLGITFILVTHDQSEALSLSSRLAIMRDGQIEQVGSPQAIYDCPKTPFVADFIGDTNLFYGTVRQTKHSLLEVHTCRGLTLLTDGPDAAIRQRNELSGQEVVVSVRPEKMYVSDTPPGDRSNCFEGKLHTTMYLGTHIQYVVALPSGDRLRVTQPNDSTAPRTPYSTIYVYWHHSDSLALIEE